MAGATGRRFPAADAAAGTGRADTDFALAARAHSKVEESHRASSLAMKKPQRQPEARGPFAVQHQESIKRRGGAGAVANSLNSRPGQKIANTAIGYDASHAKENLHDAFREPEVGTFRADAVGSDNKQMMQCSEKDIYDEVSSIVEELQAVRNSALAAGGKPSRAVEAAASALEPLLKLRNVTGGAAAGDLRQMPWLPQLLSIFRNVLHTAADGSAGPSTALSAVLSARKASSTSPRTSPDHGAGGVTTPRTPRGTPADTTAAAMAAAAAAALGALSSAAAGGMKEPSAEQRERELMRELREARRERDELAQRVAYLETVASAEMSGDATVQFLANRVAQLERSENNWCDERQSVDDRIEALLNTATTALEDNSCRRETAPAASVPYPRARKMMR